MQVIIDAPSKQHAEIIAEKLPGQPMAAALRGFGVIRIRVAHASDAAQLVPLVADCVERHSLSWARVRIDDELHMFRGGAAKTSRV